jgi:hypothetical protein
MDQLRLEAMIKAFSDWVDTSPANAGRDREALMWHRTAKVSEESGEVIDEVIKAVGGNPRKPVTGNYDAVIKELYDTANAALSAVVHLRGTADGLLDGLAAHVEAVNDRVGL